MDKASPATADSTIGRRDRFLSAVTDAAELLSRPSPWWTSINSVLRILGEATNVDRTYVFQVKIINGVECASQRFEWCGLGVTPQIDNPELQGLPLVSAGFARWVELLRVGKPVYGDIADFPESERPILEAQEIKSILIQPIMVGRTWWGFLGFDACSVQQSWQSYEVNQLLIASLLLGSAINREIHETMLLQSQRVEALGRMAGGVAHDFNNVLSIIHTALGLLKLNVAADSNHAAAQLKTCAMMEQAIERARSLTRRLLDFSKRRADKPQLVVPYDLLTKEEPLLRSSLGPGISLKIVRVESKHTPTRIRIDPTEFAQLLLNLSVNARDAMPKGGTLRFEVASVDASDSPAASDFIPPGRWTLLRVVDSGVGMPPEVIAHIFEPFFTTKGEDKGTGLGLATVRNIVLAAGGHVKVSSEVGRGTEFRFYFPGTPETEDTLP